MRTEDQNIYEHPTLDVILLEVADGFAGSQETGDVESVDYTTYQW